MFQKVIRWHTMPFPSRSICFRQLPRRFQQRGPVVRRVAALQHAPEHRVRIVPAAALAEAALVVHPGIDDQLRAGVVAKEQAEAAEKLRPEPVAVFRATRVALAVFRACGIGGNRFEDQLRHKGEQLHVRIGLEIFRVALACGRGRFFQRGELIDDRLMEQQRPAIDDHG